MGEECGRIYEDPIIIRDKIQGIVMSFVHIFLFETLEEDGRAKKKEGGGVRY